MKENQQCWPQEGSETVLGNHMIYQLFFPVNLALTEPTAEHDSRFMLKFFLSFEILRFPPIV